MSEGSGELKVSKRSFNANSQDFMTLIESLFRVAVVRRSTKEVFLLQPPAGKTWALLAIGASEVLLAENDANPVDPTHMHRLTRIKSESFPTWHASP